MAKTVDKLPPKQRKTKGLSREDLLNMDKNELVDRIIQLEAHTTQLKNIISKNEPETARQSFNQRKFDFTKCNYRRVLLHVIYFGWDYQGLAVQEDSNQTIEHHLFSALTKSCLIESRETSQYHRCGRTDKGVSAFGQIISISLRTKLHSTSQDYPFEIQYCKILNRLLPREIRVVAWMPIPENQPQFSARFDCKGRQYKYYFPKSSLDINAMRVACSHLIGSHDFRHLCKMDVGNGVTEFIRKIVSADIVAIDKECNYSTSMYALVIEGNAFLWHQIRCIMGVLLLVGQGQESPDIIAKLLDVNTNPRKPQYNMALDLPLNLFHCTYEIDSTWVYDEEELRYIITNLQSDWTMYNVKSTMIKDSLQNLEDVLDSICKKKRGDADKKIEEDRVIAHSDCLLQGVKPKIYTELLKRQTCSTLQERIEYYRKKRKVGDDDDEN